MQDEEDDTSVLEKSRASKRLSTLMEAEVPQKRAKKGDAEAEKPKMSKTQKFNNQFKEVGEPIISEANARQG